MGDRSVINVTLQEEAIEVSAVVVTALGLTREEKSLGYAVTKVDNEDLTRDLMSSAFGPSIPA
ncbi:MAG: hypothetical protein P1P83_00150 [Bacteroidales bacterium]|nr:hypothetical protein [Bacteroidales bacterium]MDT8372439.1 hypothetical protein [Bacteroidales bacterium]